MTLSKNQKVLLGIAHFLPIIGIISYIICIFSIVFGTIASIDQHHPQGPPPPEFFSGFIWVFVILIITVFVAIGVKILDIIHLVKNNKGDTGNKVLLWILLFVFAGTIAEIVYFFMEILPEKKKDTTVAQDKI